MSKMSRSPVNTKTDFSAELIKQYPRFVEQCLDDMPAGESDRLLDQIDACDDSGFREALIRHRQAAARATAEAAATVTQDEAIVIPTGVADKIDDKPATDAVCDDSAFREILIKRRQAALDAAVKLLETVAKLDALLA